MKDFSETASDQHTVYLALGSNIGDREAYLRQALHKLGTIIALHAISTIYETEPVGYLDQSPFFNLVCTGTTSLSAEELLRESKMIEQHLGRQPSFRNAPRPIDIDILFYDQLIMASDQLIIPHPRLSERAFVLVPLTEIAPGLVDPRSGKTVQELLQRISQHGVLKTDLHPEVTTKK